MKNINSFCLMVHAATEERGLFLFFLINFQFIKKNKNKPPLPVQRVLPNNRHTIIFHLHKTYCSEVYTEITALNDKISALNDSKYEALHKLIEALSDKDMKTVHRMLKANFSIEQIAELLSFSIEHVKELAKANLEQNDSIQK